ncbi:hypothetical protein Kpol_460p10 [Vanderwaltozyma polyspora DSM 70294]|uniref:Increased recombination centers protein 6 n=1 Tax=Vanderwaltozyma polyspora (strain ATCC 22028 / DSM 70294 / BCRC 21397 / CBS 2163 / NBRC 10782 / NRRL Y-8283 / UCD 57-17) TaxID=436907 RepID=IRC6_VANPO|nr:uncharacterized protein Kpol_460p10 [Vanderwaltozyma polyspora DSM 70294]A7TQS6.1 RecName: Full=Increased recombination centers protein 6 [Vanderwaltozyma polyspora DSM 70294]EDO15375.1 hypothetical protein Kpol_460p10 [Vanderwaltozyma polyspora DSM 70294]
MNEDGSVCNKILIAFQDNDQIANLKESVLGEVFRLDKANTNHDENIIKGLTWSTKYYEVRYDLYVDTFDDFEEWCKDLISSEYDDLREVLSGIIVIDSYTMEKDKIDQNKLLGQLGSVLQDKFFVFMNTNKDISQDVIDELNDDNSMQLTSDSGNSVEIINYHNVSNLKLNQYNEKIGFERVREIIDTCEWSGGHRVQTVEAKADSTDVDLESVFNRLKEARLKYLEIEDEDEREQFALEISNEFAEFLQ